MRKSLISLGKCDVVGYYSETSDGNMSVIANKKVIIEQRRKIRICIY